MHARRLSGLAAATVTVGLLSLAPPSSAAPRTSEDFYARLTAAIDASRVFERGSTLTHRSIEFSESLATPEPIVVLQTVNPNGSLTYRQTTLDTVTDVRCVRLDRCWLRQLETKGDDRDWHAMPAGAVYYSSTRPDLFAAFGEHLTTEGQFDIRPGAGGGQVFTFTYPAGTSRGEMRWTVTDHRFTWRWAGTDATGNEDVLASHAYASTHTRTTITSPSRDSMGAPASATEPDRFVDTVDVLINR